MRRCQHSAVLSNVQEHINNTIQKYQYPKRPPKLLQKLLFAFKTIYMFHAMYTILIVAKKGSKFP